MKLLTNIEIEKNRYYDFKEIYELFLKDAKSYGPFNEIHYSAVEQLVYNNVILMVDAAGKPLGFVSYNYQEDEIFISALYVIPESRGNGVASELIQRIPTKNVNGKNLPKVLYCYSDNEYALAFYKKIGFKEFFKGLWIP